MAAEEEKARRSDGDPSSGRRRVMCIQVSPVSARARQALSLAEREGRMERVDEE